MDVETLVNKLNNIKKLDKEIQVVNLEIQYLETGIFKRSTLTPTKVQTSKTTDIADQYNSMIERKKELLERIETLMGERDSLISLIDDKLADPSQRVLLRMLFIGDMAISEITDFLGIAESTIYVNRRKALEELAKAV